MARQGGNPADNLGKQRPEFSKARRWTRSFKCAHVSYEAIAIHKDILEKERNHRSGMRRKCARTDKIPINMSQF
jgi:hypothetical protein